MKICGYGLRDHIRLLAPLFGLIAAVWALRLLLDLADAPRVLVRVFSVTVVGAVALLLAVLLMHNRRFGGFPNVVVAAFLLSCWEQLLIVGAIALYAVTGMRNIYAAPEYSGHGLTPLQHIAGHLTFGLGIGTLFGTAMGSVLLWMLRKLAPAGSGK